MIQNCKPILRELVRKIDDFSEYNGLNELTKTVDFKSTSIFPEMKLTNLRQLEK
jgi:hypothetical protein